MTNKLFLPEHVVKAATKAIKENPTVPSAIDNAFGKSEENKNAEDPSQMKGSSLERKIKN